MKTNALIKITLLLLLFISFSCSEESIDETTINHPINNKTSIDLPNNGPKSQAPLKYIKVVYLKNVNKEFVRNTFSNLTQETSTINEIDGITDLWEFHSDQAIVDSLFDTNNNLCLTCNYIEYVEYVTVISVTFPPNTTNDEKEEIKNLCFPGSILQTIIENSDTETWVMKDCCLSSQTEITGDPIPYWPLQFVYHQN